MTRDRGGVYFLNPRWRKGCILWDSGWKEGVFPDPGGEFGYSVGTKTEGGGVPWSLDGGRGYSLGPG